MVVLPFAVGVGAALLSIILRTTELFASLKSVETKVEHVEAETARLSGEIEKLRETDVQKLHEDILSLNATLQTSLPKKPELSK
jgi:hypothetical protein